MTDPRSRARERPISRTVERRGGPFGHPCLRMAFKRPRPAGPGLPVNSGQDDARIAGVFA